MQTIHTVMRWDHHIREVVATWCFRTEEEAEEFYAEMKRRDRRLMTGYLQDEEIIWDSVAEALAMEEEINR